ncbi:MAG: hypothetical protein KFF73_19665 [Cyclobacteriaceae bacterium]|nr:hypothetical protein [Cyclobacteriaceae bacterium]
MLRGILLLSIFFTVFSGLYGQVKRFYTLENGDFDRVNIILKATSNSCCIKPTVNPNLVNVFGFEYNHEPTIYSTTAINDRVENLVINLDNSSGSAEMSLTDKFFKTSGSTDNHWDLYLSKEKPMKLLLNYAIGDASVDLSDLPIERLKINTGSANVNVSYMEGKSNLVEMDSFYVKVDLGSLTVNKMNHARAYTVIADVNFGALLLDYSGALAEKSYVFASVGAGNLIIGLPASQDIPVIINIHNSPLCHVKLPKKFRKKDNHVYISESYAENAPNILSFDLDVAVGQIKFVESK